MCLQSFFNLHFIPHLCLIIHLFFFCACSCFLVPVVKKTWAKDAVLLEFYSDIADPGIPTIDLGIPNTESGQYL